MQNRTIAFALFSILIIIMACSAIIFFFPTSNECTQPSEKAYYIKKSDFDKITNGVFEVGGIMSPKKRTDQNKLDNLMEFVENKTNILAYKETSCGSTKYNIRTETQTLLVKNKFPETDKTEFDRFLRAQTIACATCVVIITDTNEGKRALYPIEKTN
jgi:hypothetical protein